MDCALINSLPYDRYIFILGCERSGSTWVSNIFDSHPRTLYFFEPFAEQLCIFPELPSRNYYFDYVDQGLAELVKCRLDQLYRMKNPFLFADHHYSFLQRIENSIVQLYREWNGIDPKEGPLILQRQHSLSLNRQRRHSGIQVKKVITDRHAGANVIKELRLNFKISLLATLYPNSKYLVTIREPGAQIQSITERIEKGSLKELHNSLKSLWRFVIGNERFYKYKDAICDWEQFTLPQQLAWWWLIQYEILLEDLTNYNLDFFLIFNEQLSVDPVAISEQIFRFCELDLHPNVRNYVALSTDHEEKRNIGTLDTFRRSEIYYRQRIQSVSLEIRKAVYQVWSSADHVCTVRSLQTVYFRYIGLADCRIN